MASQKLIFHRWICLTSISARAISPSVRVGAVLAMESLLRARPKRFGPGGVVSAHETGT